MKQNEWNEGLNNLDRDIIENYVAQKEAYIKKIKKPTMWTRYISIAAAVCLVLGVLAVSLILNRSDDEPITIPETEAETTKADTENAPNTEDEPTQTEAPSETVGGVVTEVTSEDVSESESVETTAGEKETDEETSEQTTTEETTVTPETENNEPYEIKVDDYTLIKNENGCYLTFDDISKYQNNSSNGSSVLGEIIFGSVKEFKDTVTKGLLTDWQKEIVSRFENVGDNIQTCDFNNLYEPKLPQGSNAKEVYWNGTAYSYLVMMSDQSFGYVRCYTKEMYDEIFQSKYEDFFNQDTITVTGTEVIDGKEITYYKTSTGVSSYNERYTLTNGNKTVTVDKIFYSSNMLNRVTLYCTDGFLHYTVTLHKLTEDPTDEWLLEFGLKPYIENDHEVM